jgi:hypothetical protein
MVNSLIGLAMIMSTRMQISFLVNTIPSSRQKEWNVV